MKCIDCKNSRGWTYTPTGRLKKNTTARCEAPLPELPVVLHHAWKPGRLSLAWAPVVWPELDGHCDLFIAKDSK